MASYRLYAVVNHNIVEQEPTDVLKWTWCDEMGRSNEWAAREQAIACGASREVASVAEHSFLPQRASGLVGGGSMHLRNASYPP